MVQVNACRSTLKDFIRQETFQQPPQLFFGVKIDDDAAATAFFLLHAHFGAEPLPQAVFDVADDGRLLFRPRPFFRPLARRKQLLDLPYREILFHHPERQRLLCRRTPAAKSARACPAESFPSSVSLRTGAERLSSRSAFAT